MIPGPNLPSLDRPPIRLRELTPADVPGLFAIFSDVEVMRYWSRAPMTEIAEAQRLLEEIQECFAARTLFEWGVALVETDQVVGTCTLSALDPSNRRAEVGFTLNRGYWGQGLARRAVSSMVDFAFGTLNLHRLEADVDPRNGPSLGLLRRLGFVHEGTLRQRWIVAGEVCDTALLGLLRADWET